MKASRRHALAKAIQLSLLIGLPGFAAAQDAAPAREATTLDTVQVTGTRIKKAEIESQVPVQTLTREDIERTGLTSIGDVVQELTGSGSSFNGKRNASGNDGFPSDGGGVGAGATTVDLRHLGSKRVLVLVDGIRWVNESSASGVGSSTDLNTIPLAIVERIEVLEDGASSLYGSDAIAGVVNIITRRNFDGFQLTTNFGQYTEGDGTSRGLDFAYGGSSDRATWFLGASYTKQDEVSSSDRERSRFPVPGTGLALGSSRVPGGRIAFTAPDGRKYDLVANAGQSNPTYTPGQAPCSAGVPRTDGFHCFGSNDPFNFAPFNYVLSPSERKGVFGQFRFDINDKVRWYARALLNRRDSENRAAPEPIDLGPGAGNEFAANVVIPVNHPFNPFGVQLDSSNLSILRRRPVEGGPRRFEQQVDTWFVGTGLEGTFDVGERAWFWDANLASSRNKAEQTNRGSYNAKNIATAMGDPAICAATPGCTPLNIFGYNTITPAMLKWISPVLHDRSENKLQQATFNLSGDLFEMWAGPLSFATGYEYRKYEGSYRPDPITVRGEYNGVPSLPTQGEYDVNEVYVELNVPLFKDSAFGKGLDLSLAGRYSDYSTFGGEFTPKYGLRWQVADELLLRGTYAEGFRAPSIGELFGSQSRADVGMIDPCLIGSNGAPPTGNAANCAAQGVNPGTRQVDPQISVLTGGNPNLEPERSTSFSLGFVWSPSILEDSAIAKRVDIEGTFYSHRIEGAIQAIDPQTQLNLCVQTLSPEFCGGIQRNPITDQIDGFANFLGNLSVIKTDGWDIDVFWTLPETRFGQFKLIWQNTIVGNYEAVGADGSLQPLQVGRLVSDPVTRSIPEWTSNATLEWSYGHWNASWTARHISQLVEDCGDAADFAVCKNDPQTGQNRLGATTFHDFQVGYRFDVLKGLQLQAGMNNVFGKDPPVCLACNLNGFDGSTYDLPGGGYYYLRADLRF
ncbi:TonB-dependent receptor plug domain-containing protein [Lysobacter capsici]|uniref:TonB-dependent receptor plug domain-containing protein n=1 Tax=Lysobacter capsici TaxID=435897 RepID=UPI000BBB062C|nr:TonB-dependent receptor [Lysobacter capsici]ATE70278.1 TonB-dependent receptor [Lysobacter capsici]